MKKYIKTILAFLLCFTLSTSHINVEPEFENRISNEVFANYNELYGVEEQIEPQLRLSSSKTTSLDFKYLAVFIEFADSDDAVVNHLDSEESVANALQLLNGDELVSMDSVKGTIGVPSFKKYYEMQSYGKLNITTEIFPKVDGKVVSYRDTHPMSYYLKYDASNPDGYKDSAESLARETELIDSAIAHISKMVEDAGITASEIDTGNDGIVDAISFFIEGRDVLDSAIGWGDLLWSHKLDNYGLHETILGKKVITYNLLYTYDYTEVAGLFSLNRGTYGTIIHEFGHTLGLMDLYRFDQSNASPVGFYDVMGQTVGSNPQNILTYFTSEYSTNLAWHEPLEVLSSTTKNVTLFKPQFLDAGEKRAVKLQIDPSADEFFVIEYHEKQNTYDTYSADSSGIIVYRVNELNKYSGNKEGGDHGELDHIFVFRPNETSLGTGGGDLSKATLNMSRPILGKDLGNATGFDNETIYYSNGNNSGITIKVTGETADSITFDVTFPTIEGNGTKESPYEIASPEMFIYMTNTDTQGKYYKLTSDLDFTGIDYPAIEFKGNLDGDGKTIKNISAETGIFDMLGNPTTPSKIENIFVENIAVSSTKGTYLGGFASTTYNVTISNVHLLSGSVTNTESKTGNMLDSTGGFVGNVSDDTVIENCSSSLTVTAPKNVGGFIGVNLNATIKDSFADGTVNGSDTVGAFIGLQCIMGDSYHIPQNAYYKVTGDIQPVGGYSSFLHNSNALDPSNLALGIIGIRVPENINIELGKNLYFAPSTTDNYPITYQIESENENILEYSNGYLIAITKGVANVYIDVQIGSYKMHLSTRVLVVGDSKDITESDVFTYYNLTNKEGYITGFTLGDSVQNVKRVLASYPGVVLKSFQNSAGQEIDSGIISTNMRFTLIISGIEHRYIAVVKGDANGDGLIYATDYVRIKNHIMGRQQLKDAYYRASDIDNDGNIYATDYVKVRNHIMGRGTLPQK